MRSVDIYLHHIIGRSLKYGENMGYIAVNYWDWELSPDAMMRDVILAIRADEAHHRLVNHTLASMKLKDQNPFKPGATHYY